MNGLQMNMILQRFTELEAKLDLIVKASGILETGPDGSEDSIAEDGPVDNIADPTKAVSYSPDVKGPNDPDNKANQVDPDEGTVEDVVNDNRLSKGPMEDAVDKHYEKFPKETGA